MRVFLIIFYLVHNHPTSLGKRERQGALHTVPQTAFPLHPGRGGPLLPVPRTGFPLFLSSPVVFALEVAMKAREVGLLRQFCAYICNFLLIQDV